MAGSRFTVTRSHSPSVMILTNLTIFQLLVLAIRTRRTALVAVLTVRTVVAVRRHEICRPETDSHRRRS